VLAAIVLAVVYRSFLETGHDWGDDFSLYINQARSLVRGDVPQVIADTRYALQNSGTDSFSPYVYPWGLPLLLAPVYLVAGIDYSAFSWITAGSLVFFLWGFRRLIAKSIGALPATALTVVIALSVSYVRATGAILSDLPAIAATVAALLWVEHCRAAGHFARSTRTPLVVAGLLVTWAFSIRRETVVLLVAMFVVHLVALRGRDDNDAAPSGPVRPRLVDVAAPYWTFALAAGAFHLVLPASLEQQASDGGGLGQVRGNLEWYRDVFAEQIGLKELGPNEIEWFGSGGVGRVLISTIAVLAVFGVGVAFARRRGPELMIAVHVPALAWMILSQPFRDGRYIFGLTPFVLYFAWLGATQLVEPLRGDNGAFSRLGRVAALVPWLVVAPLVAANADGFQHAWKYHREYDYVVNGPETNESREMFDAVRRCTRGDEVVLFARARAMNLYTNRRSIQTGDVNIGLLRADWMMLTNDDVDYFEPKVNEQNYRGYGLAKVWTNSEFTLYRVGTPPAGLVEACPVIDQ
jgi:hypothetical protein